MQFILVMSVRQAIWIVHAVLVVLLVSIVGTWALVMIDGDDGVVQLGRVLGLIGASAALVHAMVTTALVAVWARRPLAVIGIHVFGMGITALVFTLTCTRVG